MAHRTTAFETGVREKDFEGMTSRRLFRLIAWACVAAIVTLSLVSPSLRPVTRLPHNLEHLAIFAIMGVALGLGYPGRLMRHIALLVIFAGAIEVAQFVTPGRHPRLIDFVVDAASACAGAALAALLVRLKPGLVRG
jgi:VanZ family protein